MIKAEYTMKLGSEEVKITIDAESHVDFVDKLSFFTTIPKKGPNGEEDLRLVHRVAQNKFHYYSLISDSAKMEYKFGQSLENKGALFCKGQWEPLFTGDGTDQQETQSQTQNTQQTVTQPAKAVTAAVKTVTPTTTKTMPTTPTTTTPVTTAKPLASVNLAKPAVTTAVKTQPATTQVQAQTTTPAQPASTPAPPKSNAAAAILAKMNINKTT